MTHREEYLTWTIEQFRALPSRQWDQPVGPIDELVILPTDEMHDSGFRCMDFAAVRNGVPFVLLSGCTDAMDLRVANAQRRGDCWRLDMLPASGLVRLFGRGPISVTEALSSMDAVLCFGTGK